MEKVVFAVVITASASQKEANLKSEDGEQKQETVQPKIFSFRVPAKGFF